MSVWQRKVQPVLSPVLPSLSPPLLPVAAVVAVVVVVVVVVVPPTLVELIPSVPLANVDDAPVVPPSLADSVAVAGAPVPPAQADVTVTTTLHTHARRRLHRILPSSLALAATTSEILVAPTPTTMHQNTGPMGHARSDMSHGP